MKTKNYLPWNIKPGFITYLGTRGQFTGLNQWRQLTVSSVLREHAIFSRGFVYRVQFTDGTRACYFGKSGLLPANQFTRYFE